MNEEKSEISFWILLAVVAILGVIYFAVRKPPITNEKKLDVAILPTNSFDPYQPPLDATPQKPTLAKADYIEVINSCGPYYNLDTCVVVRSGPSTTYPSIARLRDGIVLRISNTVEADGHTWYKIMFDDWLRYPERVAGDWYVSGDFVKPLVEDVPSDMAAADYPETTKRIVVNRTKQMLYAYDGDTLFMEEHISTGLELTPTPRGTFHIFRKTPSRYMQGPLPDISDQYYDLPGVPWTLYFTKQGAAIHGAYWHDNFGQPWSHGCVNLPIDSAEKIYHWADLGTPVTVID